MKKRIKERGEGKKRHAGKKCPCEGAIPRKRGNQGKRESDRQKKPERLKMKGGGI